MEYLLALPLIVWGLVSFAIYRTVRLLARPKSLLQDVGVIDDEAFLKQKAVLSAWCQKNGFVHEKDFLFHGMLNSPPAMCSAWWSITDSTWALIYFAPSGSNIDFFTAYGNDVSVTTSSSKDALNLPSAPGSYAQAFINIGNDERYFLHKEAIREVNSYFYFSEDYEKGDLFEKISEHMRRQVVFIESLPFWYFRGAYWYFIYPCFRLNRKIRISGF